MDDHKSDVVESCRIVDVEIEKPDLDQKNYRVIILENDLHALLISDPTTDMAAASMDVQVGSWSDGEIDGLAHFCEHMLFLGTTKYPDENAYSAFLNMHGGSANAFTADENTNYFFDIAAEHLDGALDHFAQFFISPLFTETATERELNAIDSEHSKNRQSDYWRGHQLLKIRARPNHPFSRFSTGNRETLVTIPENKHISIRQQLFSFYSNNYSANMMKLCVIGKETIEELTKIVCSKFSAIQNKQLTESTFSGSPFPDANKMTLMYTLPVRDSRKVRLTWQLPPQRPMYESKPAGYLSHLLGHEGAGSMLVHLREKNLANELTAGVFDSNSNFSTFVVLIDLTNFGFEHVEDVVCCVFDYLNMLWREINPSPPEWIFDEIREIDAMNFKYKNDTQPSDYVCELASNMSEYPHARIISGSDLVWRFAPSEILSILQQLVPENMLMTIEGQANESIVTETDHWYDAKYHVVPISNEWMKLFCDRCHASSSDVHSSSSFHLPSRNDFIPTRFDLKSTKDSLLYSRLQQSLVINLRNDDDDDDKKQDDATPDYWTEDEAFELSSSSWNRTYPTLLSSTPLLTVWFKQDDVYNRPNLSVSLKMTCAEAHSPLHIVYLDIFSSMVKDFMNEMTGYNAQLAGCRFDVRNAIYGMFVAVSGYDDKLPLLLRRIFDAMKSISSNSNHDDGAVRSLFDRTVEKTRLRFANFAFSSSLSLASYYSMLAMTEPRYSNDDKMRAIHDVRMNLDGLRGFLNNCLLDRMMMEMLIHGNYTAVEAGALANDLRFNWLSSGSKSALSSSEWTLTRCVKMKMVEDVVLSTPSLNANEENSGVTYTLFLLPRHDDGDGDGRMTDLTMLHFLANVMSEPAFDELRTKQQLGYIVGCDVRSVGYPSSGVASLENFGLSIYIQSNQQNPRYLTSRIEEFVTFFSSVYLAGMSDDDFNKNVDGEVDRVLETPKNSDEEVSSYWSCIEESRFTSGRMFSYFESRARCLEEFKGHKQDLLDFFNNRLVGDLATGRRRFVTQIWGKDHVGEIDVVSSSGQVTNLSVGGLHDWKARHELLNSTEDETMLAYHGKIMEKLGMN